MELDSLCHDGLAAQIDFFHIRLERHAPQCITAAAMAILLIGKSSVFFFLKV